MRFEIHGPGFGDENDEIQAPEGVWNGMIFQAIRLRSGVIAIREARGGPEICYVAVKGDEPDVIHVHVADLLFSEMTNADPEKPLLYLWEVAKDGQPFYRYVGKARDASRPRTHYRRNVRNLFAGRPYRKGAPDGFRAVHKQLAMASKAGLPVVLTLLRNVSGDEDILVAEREAQREWMVDTYLGFDTP